MTSFPVKTAPNDARVIWGLLALVLGSWLLLVAVVALLVAAVGLALGAVAASPTTERTPS